MTRRSILLASASPRRQELLRSLGLSFAVEPADVDETEFDGEAALPYVERVASAKADEIASRRDDLEGVVVLAADTTVDVDGAILAKPVDDDDARRMLRLLAGRTHHVHTAVVCRHVGGVGAVTVTTGVTFAALDDADIDWYVGRGEHRDKAGAYGMQYLAEATIPDMEPRGLTPQALQALSEARKQDVRELVDLGDGHRRGQRP